jgi:hypothetical protein
MGPYCTLYAGGDLTKYTQDPCRDKGLALKFGPTTPLVKHVPNSRINLQIINARCQTFGQGRVLEVQLETSSLQQSLLFHGPSLWYALQGASSNDLGHDIACSNLGFLEFREHLHRYIGIVPQDRL